jgi:hypothetical protein
VNYATGIETNHLNVTSNTTIGNIRYIKNGIGVTSSNTLTLNTPLRVSGNLNFGTTPASLSLGGDLTLASDAYLTSGMKLAGNGYSLALTSSLVVPASKTVRITANTIIDGGGNDVVLASSGKFQIDANCTLTLRNMTLKGLSGTESPQIVFGDTSANLCLQNVTIYMDGNYSLGNSAGDAGGRVYIEDDVILRGNYTLEYTSYYPLYIQSNAMLYVDSGTTFKFNPGGGTSHTSDYRSMLRMTDATSWLYFNNSTFEVPVNGVELSKGTLILDNKVSFLNKNDTAANTDSSKAITLGTGSAAGDMYIYLLAGARAEVTGYLDYNNTN